MLNRLNLDEEDGSLNISDNLYKEIADLLESTRYDNIQINEPHEYVDKALELLQEIPLGFFELQQSPLAHRKWCRASKSSRQQGNMRFKKKQWLEALKFYNFAICLARNNSLELAYAYANRSALLCKRKYFKECLEDIERVLSYNNYPQDKKQKILTRQKRAQSLLSTQRPKEFHSEIPSIPNKNPTIEAAADCIKINQNDQYGRFIEATRDIKAGEIIAVEKPYVMAAVEEFKFYYCNECGEACFTMIPCTGCSSELYCSVECRDKAFNDYHEYECVICRYFRENFMDLPLGWIGLRTTLKGLKEYKNLDQESTEKYQSGRYKEISELVSHLNKLSKKIVIELSYNVAKIFFVLKRDTNILTRYDITENELKFLLLRDKMINSVNDIPVNVFTPDKTYCGVSIAAGLYAFSSLFNHSCAENSFCFTYGSTVVVRTFRHVKKGEQLYINYGLQYLSTPKDKRQRTLKLRHLFDCDCVACVGDWPVADKGCHNEATCVDSLDRFINNQNIDDLPFNPLITVQLMTLMKDIFDGTGNRIPISEDKREEILRCCFSVSRKIEGHEPSYNHLLLQELIDRVMHYGNFEVRSRSSHEPAIRVGSPENSVPTNFETYD